MDTRYWGPSGWKLLHLIAIGPNASKNRTFWEMLPFILPCKFCRASLSIYYEKHPIPKYPSKFSKWLYTIHNCVNNKLREQGQSVDLDPSFTEVNTLYTSLLEQGCTKTYFPGWDFLFSIADNHPASSPSKPMPDAPETPPKTKEERNKYNLLTIQERKDALYEFWKSIPDVLPFEEWQSSWKEHQPSIGKVIQGRKQAISWVWKIRCGLDNDLNILSKDSFYGLCQVLRNHRSGCSTSRNARTCRRIKKLSFQKTRKHKQR